jgi:hypothetical protein
MNNKWSAKKQKGEKREVIEQISTRGLHSFCGLSTLHTGKEENQIFLINKEIQCGAVAKS